MATKTIRRIYTDNNGLEHYTTHSAPMDYQIRAGTQTDKFGKDFREEEFNPSAASQISRGVAPSVAGTAIAGMSNQSGAGVTQGLGAIGNAAANVAANRLQAHHADSKLAAMSAAGLSTGASAARNAANQEMLRTGNAGQAALAGLAGGAQGLVGGAISSIPGAKSLAAGIPNMIGGLMSGGLAGGLHGFASGVMTSKTLGSDMANLMQRSQAKDYNEGTWGSSMTNIEDENRQDALAKEQRIREAAHNKAISDGEVDEDRIKAAGDAAVAAHRQNVAQPQAAAPQQQFDASSPVNVPQQNQPVASNDAEENPVAEQENLADPEAGGVGLPNFASIQTGVAGQGDAVGAVNAAMNPPTVAPSRFAGVHDVRPQGQDATQSPAAAAAAAPVAPPPPAAAAPVAAAAAAPVPAPAPMPAAPAAAAMPVAPRMDTVNPEAPTYDDITGDNNFFPQVSVPNAAAGVAAAVAPQARLNLPNEENVAADAAAAAHPLPPPPPLPPVEPPRYIDTRAAAAHAPAAAAPVRAAAAAAAPAPAPAPARIPNAEDAPEIPDMTPEEIQARMDSDANFSAADLNDRELAAFETHQNKLLEDVAENATDESLDAKIREHARRINSSEEFARQALPDEVLLNHPHLRGRFMRVIPDTDEELEERANQIAAAELDEANPDSIPEDWRQFASGETMDNIGIQQGRHANLTDESGAVTVNGKKYFRTPFGLVRAYDKDRESKDIGNAYQATLYHMESELRAGHLDVAKQIYDSLHREDRGILQTSKDRVRQSHMMLNDMTSVLGQKALDGNTTLGELNHLADLAKQEFENVPENLRDKRHAGSEKTLREIYDNFTEQFDHAIDLRQERGMNRDTVLGFEVPQWMTGKPAPRRSVGAAVGRDGIDGGIRHHDDDDEDSYDEDDDDSYDEGGVAAAAAPVRNLLHMAGEGGERSGLLQEGEAISPEEFARLRKEEIIRNSWGDHPYLDPIRHAAGNAAIAATRGVKRAARAVGDWIAPPYQEPKYDLPEGKSHHDFSDYNMKQLWNESRKMHPSDSNYFEKFTNRAKELMQDDSINYAERKGFHDQLNFAEKQIVPPPSPPLPPPPSMIDRAKDYARRIGEYVAPIYPEEQEREPDIFDHVGNFLRRGKSAAADVARDTQEELADKAERARLRLQTTARRAADAIGIPNADDEYFGKSKRTEPYRKPKKIRKVLGETKLEDLMPSLKPQPRTGLRLPPKPAPPPPTINRPIPPENFTDTGRFAGKSLDELTQEFPTIASTRGMNPTEYQQLHARMRELVSPALPSAAARPPSSAEVLDRVKQIGSRKSAAASFPKPDDESLPKIKSFENHSLKDLENILNGHDEDFSRGDTRSLHNKLGEGADSFDQRANEIMSDDKYPYDDRLRLHQRMESIGVDLDNPTKLTPQEQAEREEAERKIQAQIENDRQRDLALAGAREARVDPEMEKRNLPFVENLPKKYPAAAASFPPPIEPPAAATHDDYRGFFARQHPYLNRGALQRISIKTPELIGTMHPQDREEMMATLNGYMGDGNEPIRHRREMRDRFTRLGVSGINVPFAQRRRRGK